MRKISRASLLKKFRRGVGPTAAGPTLAERARVLLRDAHRIAEDMQLHRADAAELVPFMSTDSPAAGLLLDDISDFLGQPAHCAIRLKMIAEKDQVAVLQAVKAGIVQFGVLWDAIEMADFQTLAYCGDQLAVVCQKKTSFGATSASHAGGHLEISIYLHRFGESSRRHVEPSQSH